MCFKKIPVILLLFFCWEGISTSKASCSVSYQPIVEYGKFYTNDSLPLESILLLPEQSVPKRVVVYIPPLDEYDNLIKPMISKRELVGSLGKLLDNLLKNDIAVFTFSMRISCYNDDFKQSVEIKKSDSYRSQTLCTLAEDAKSACRSLKEDDRFKDIPIGVIGTSAMGRAATMAAAGDKSSFSYAILFATPSTDSFDNAEWSYEQGSQNYVMLREGYFTLLWSMVKDTAFTYRSVRYTADSPQKLQKKFVDCAWDCFKRINRTIIAATANYDSIQHKASALMKESFQWNRTSGWYPVKGLEDGTPEVFIDSMMWYWHKPIDISFLRWNPEEWYPKLQCPTLVLFGSDDKVIDTWGSRDNVQRIKKKYGKTNIQVEMIQGVEHSFIGKGEKELFDKLIEWQARISDIS